MNEFDPLDLIEQRGRLERQDLRRSRRLARNEPEARMKRDKGRKARRRGRDFERIVAAYLGGELVPGSGAYGSGQYFGGLKLKGDVRLKVGNTDLQIQCKRTRALATQRKWLDADGSDILVQADPGEKVNRALVVMRVELFLRLLEGVRNGQFR